MSAQEVPHESEGLILTDDSHAEWAMRKRRSEAAEIQRITELEKAEIQRIKEWAADARAPRRADLDRWDAALIDYMRRLEDADPDRPKTLRLPSGVVKRRKQPVAPEIINADELVNWALGSDPSILAKPTAYVSKITAANGYRFTDDGMVVLDGEVVPGVHVVGGDDRYSVGEK